MNHKISYRSHLASCLYISASSPSRLLKVFRIHTVIAISRFFSALDHKSYSGEAVWKSLLATLPRRRSFRRRSGVLTGRNGSVSAGGDVFRCYLVLGWRLPSAPGSDRENLQPRGDERWPVNETQLISGDSPCVDREVIYSLRQKKISEWVPLLSDKWVII